jgi:alpha-L-fucosidase
MTMNRTWGYKSYDHDWKSTEDLIQKLCDIASKGGNFLLNVGPTAEGIIPQPSIDRLEEIGAWMDVNGESIYGTTASPFHRLSWGRCTKKLSPEAATLYLHVFEWPEDGKLHIPGLKNIPVSVQLLQDGKSIKAKQVKGDKPGIELKLPKDPPDPIVSVIKLEIKGELQVEAVMPKQAKNGQLVLEPDFADLHNRLGTDLRLEGKEGKTNIGYWTDNRTWVSWTFEIKQPGKFTVQAEISAEDESQLMFNVSQQKGQEASLEATEGFSDFQLQELGTLEISEKGIHILEFRPVREGWKPVNLRSVTLVPVK